MSSPGHRAEPLAEGWAALRAGDWCGAKSCFERALADGESPEAYEGLGWAAYCLDEDALTFQAREQAFRCYRDRGDDHEAARVAAWLAADWLEFRGEAAVANGWLQRAHRLLDDAPEGPGHGWLAVHEASIVVEDDPSRARQLARRAVEIGRRCRVLELEMVGLGIEGVALVSEGEATAGMRRLDEATAVALSGEAGILCCVAWACCYLIAACEMVRDYDRAGEWCRRVDEFCERYNLTLPMSVCQAKYAGVLTWQGRWDEADVELASAIDGLAAGRPPMVVDGLVRLAELRRRQGRLDEAAELFARCDGVARALLGRAELALQRGDPDEAAELADRYLRHYSDHNRIERAAGLEVAIRARLAGGDLDRAELDVGELDALAARAGTRLTRAAVLTARGRIDAARGDHDGARRWLEDALDVLSVSGAPYETAQVRLDLAGVLSALGRDGAARREIELALALLHPLDARIEIERAEVMASKLAGYEHAVDGRLRQLSKRELEVLALVAEGLTNHAIAERLVVSEHTVHRHLANIYRKLDVPSRAAAASVAAHHGLA